MKCSKFINRERFFSIVTWRKYAIGKKKRKKNADPEVIPKAQPQLSATMDEALLWDIWYKRVNDLVCQALIKSMPKHGNPAGFNRIKITVSANHQIEANLIEGRNQQFDAAILEAYASLNGKPELAFPQGTHRQTNVYETQHIQEIPAATSAFDSRTIHGDMETFVK